MSLPAIAPRVPHERSAPLGVYLGLGSTALCFVLELLGMSGARALAFVLVPAIVVTLGVCVLISLDFPRLRATTTRVFRALGYAIAVFVATFPLTYLAHRISVHRARERAEPLIAALHAYEERHAQPPASLEALVPEFLPEIPTTGRASASTYGYHRFEAQGTRHEFWHAYFDATWLLFGPTFVYTSNEPGSAIRGQWREDPW